MVIGGVATLAGPAIGAIFIQFFPEWTQGYNEQLSPVIFGLALIALMIVMPGGIVGFFRTVEAWLRRQLLSRRRPPSGEEPAEVGTGPPGGSDRVEADEAEESPIV